MKVFVEFVGCLICAALMAACLYIFALAVVQYMESDPMEPTPTILKP